jgi:hypothetical protein
MEDDMAPFEGSESNDFFYRSVGETLKTDLETQNHDGAMAGTSKWYVREVDLEGYEKAVEVRHVWDDGLEIKTDKDTLYALKDGNVDIWMAYPQDRHNQNTGYDEEPNESRPVEEISDERALDLLGGA